MRDIILTNERIDAGRSGTGGWNKAQLAAIGIGWEQLQSPGWKQRNVGRAVSREAYGRFLALTGMSKKGRNRQRAAVEATKVKPPVADDFQAALDYVDAIRRRSPKAFA